MDVTSEVDIAPAYGFDLPHPLIAVALCIIDEVIDLSHIIRINLHQCKRLVAFYTRARSYIIDLERSGVFVRAHLYDDVVDALEKGRCLINGYVEANWLKSVEDTGVNQDAFAEIHVRLEDSFRVICEDIEAGNVSHWSTLVHKRLHLLLEFDTLAPLYFLDDEYRATVFERDAQMDKKHMLEIITGLGDQLKHMIERIESTTITTNRLRAALDREQGRVAVALLKNKESKVVLLRWLVKQKKDVEKRLEEEEPWGAEEGQYMKGRNKRVAASSSTRTDLLQDFRIQFSEIQIGDKIGSGGFATIHKCQWQNHNYALKMFEATDVEGLRTEVQNLVLLPRHPNVVLLVGFSIHNDGTPMLLMELMDGDLQTLVYKAEKHRSTNRNPLLWFGRDAGLSTAMKVDFIHQIAKGMLFLHRRKVFHGDLKAKNVLVKQHPGETIQLKITDFGLSERLMLKPKILKKSYSDEDFDCSSFSDDSLLGVRHVSGEEGDVQRVVVGNVGTTRWMAPEVYGVSDTTDMKPYSMKADVYSFAMTCIEILTGQDPFPHIEFAKAVKMHVKSGERPYLSKYDIPEALLDLVKRCWNANPSSRPDFSEIYATMQKLKEAFPIK